MWRKASYEITCLKSHYFGKIRLFGFLDGKINFFPKIIFSKILKLKNMLFLFLSDKISIFEFQDYIKDDCPNAENIVLILKECQKSNNLKEYYIFHYYRLVLHILEIFWEDILVRKNEEKKRVSARRPHHRVRARARMQR